MVKIRYAALRETSARDVINIALLRTTVKFNNNIEANRFEQVGSHYEVTIKAKSSRSKGAKRGVGGRRTSSACWHAWGTFFEELFKLNPNIVIIAQGNRITAREGNWVDRNVVAGRLNESEMCDCEANGWTRESPVDTLIDRAMEAGREALSMARQAGEEETDLLHAQWITEQTYVSAAIATEEETAIPNRDCDTCRYSYENGATTNCFDIVGHCSTPSLARWELFVAPPVIKRSCSTCKYNNLGYDSRGVKKCKGVIGTCERYNKWTPIEDDGDELCIEKYILKPTVMPEEKSYIDPRMKVE